MDSTDPTENAEAARSTPQRAGTFFAAVGIYVASVLILGALLAPALNWLLHVLVDAGIAGSLADTPFKRVANRAFMLVAIVGLWPLGRAIGRVSRDDLGVTVPRKTFWRALGIGFAAGLATLSALAIAEYALGVIVWDDDRSAAVLIKALFSGILSGLVIASIEEPVFRGVVQSQIQRQWGTKAAVVGSAMAYAAVHFIRSEGNPDPIRWYSGFEVLASAFSHFTDPKTIGPFLALTAVGVWLSLIRLKTGHIAWGIGLHAGWVAVIRIARKATNLTDDPSLAWLADGYDQITGWLAAAWLICLTVAWWLWFQRRAAKTKSP